MAAAWVPMDAVIRSHADMATFRVKTISAKKATSPMLTAAAFHYRALADICLIEAKFVHTAVRAPRMVAVIR